MNGFIFTAGLNNKSAQFYLINWYNELTFLSFMATCNS